MRPSARRATLLAGLGAGLVVIALAATQWRTGVELWHVARLESSDPGTRANALEALKAMSPDPRLRRGAAVALGHYGHEAAAFGPALLEAAGGEDEALQAEALVSLSGVGGVEEAALVQKAAALLGSSPHGRVRAAAARVLGEAGAEARAAAPLLRKASEDEDARVRAAAARALQLTGEGG